MRLAIGDFQATGEYHIVFPPRKFQGEHRVKLLFRSVVWHKIPLGSHTFRQIEFY